jgi:tetratricopeptide (TPR) repeat protein
MKTTNRLFLICVSTLMIAIQFQGMAQKKTFIREYSYKASEADSKITARAIATQEIRTELLYELGSYIQSEQILVSTDYKAGDYQQDFQEKISALTAGITKLEVLDETWDGSTYYLKASITVDQEDLKKQLEATINDKTKTAELEKLRAESQKAQEKIKALQKQLTNAKTLTAQLQIQQQYNIQTSVISAKEYFNMGYKAYADGEYNLSMEFFSNAAKIGGDSLIAFQNLGRISQRLEDHEGTIFYLEKVLAVDSENETDSYGLAFAYYYLKNYDSAIYWCDRALAINFARPEYYKLKSLCFAAKGDESGAVSSLKKAAQLGDEDAQTALEEKGKNWR